MGFMKIFHDDDEIIPQGNERFILAGKGNKKLMENDKRGRFNASVFIPNSVESGKETMRQYIERSIQLAEEEDKVPVVVFPIFPDPIYIEEPGRKNLHMTLATKRSLIAIASKKGADVYVQCLGKVFYVDEIEDIDRIPGIKNTREGTILEIGRPGGVVIDFYHDYLSNLVEIFSTNSTVYGHPLATSLPALERNFTAHVKEHDSAYFVMVIQARNTYGPPGTLYAPTPLITALAVATLNHFALENDIEFHAFFSNESKQAGDDKHKKEIEQQFEPGIKKVFERSVAIRDNNEEVQTREKESWNALARAYPRVKLNKIDLTFIDGEEVERTGQARSRPINDLATPKKYLKKIPENWRVLVTNAVNYLLSKKRDRTEKATTRAKTAIDKFSTSMIRREKSRDDLAAKAVASIVGRYPLDETHDIIITDDPISMFAKSTGQDWEEESCEKDGGSHNAGVYSDIEIGNCIAFIVEKENDHPIARIMLRWCDEKNTKTKKIGFGIERRWYFTTSPGRGAKIENTSKNLMYRDMPFAKATASVVKILKERNVYDYKQCVTPYSYGGYSDVMQTSHVHIEYKNLLDTNKVLFSRYIEGLKVDFSKIDMNELYSTIMNEPEILNDLTEQEFDFIIASVSKHMKTDAAESISHQILQRIPQNKKVITKLATAILDGANQRMVNALNSDLHYVMRNDFHDFIQDGNKAGIIKMFSDPIYKRLPIKIAELLTKMTGEGKGIIASIPENAIKQYKDHPVVLMAALAMYEVSKNTSMFEWCAKQLAFLYSRDEIVGKLKAASAHILKTNGRSCPVGTNKIREYFYCRGNPTDDLFITHNYLRRGYSVGISVVIDDSIESEGARGFSLTGDPHLDEDLESSSLLVKRSCKHLHDVLEKIGTDKLLRYP